MVFKHFHTLRNSMQTQLYLRKAILHTATFCCDTKTHFSNITMHVTKLLHYESITYIEHRINRMFLSAFFLICGQFATVDEPLQKFAVWIRFKCDTPSISNKNKAGESLLTY